MTAGTNTSSSSDSSKPDEDCRACKDIQKFIKGYTYGHRSAKKAAEEKRDGKTSKTPSSTSRTIATMAPATSTTADDRECPLDRAELGRNSWSVLHTMAAYYPTRPTLAQQHAMSEFMSGFSRFYPCATCRSHLVHDLRHHPPRTESRAAFSLWMCDLHNRVNKRLGKKLFDCKLVDQRWRTGPPDKSCDE